MSSSISKYMTIAQLHHYVQMFPPVVTELRCGNPMTVIDHLGDRIETTKEGSGLGLFGIELLADDTVPSDQIKVIYSDGREEFIKL